MSGTDNSTTTEATQTISEQEADQKQADSGTTQEADTTTEATQTKSAQQSTTPTGSTMSVHKHQREMAKVEAERDAAKAEAEGYKKLEAEFAEWKASQEAEKSEKALKDAGCIDTVAASARLKEFDGDISKLKEAAPYLFASSDHSKKTGGNPVGTPDPEDVRNANMRKLMGVSTEKE